MQYDESLCVETIHVLRSTVYFCQQVIFGLRAYTQMSMVVPIHLDYIILWCSILLSTLHSRETAYCMKYRQSKMLPRSLLEYCLDELFYKTYFMIKSYLISDMSLLFDYSEFNRIRFTANTDN